MTEEKAKSVNFTSGLLIGTIASAVIAYLYKTESGKKTKKIISAYYREAKNHVDQLIKEVKKQTKTVSLPEAVEMVARKKIKTIKKNVFSKSGRPLVK
ncbi:MAG: YtxH domain-containing protein [Candidatus Beckwithbacteria bacterium]